MVFQRPDGSGVAVMSEHRRKPPKRLTAEEIAIRRGATVAAWLREGLSIQSYADAYRISRRTAERDLDAYRAAVAKVEGRSTRTADEDGDVRDEDDDAERN